MTLGFCTALYLLYISYRDEIKGWPRFGGRWMRRNRRITNRLNKGGKKEEKAGLWEREEVGWLVRDFQAAPVSCQRSPTHSPQSVLPSSFFLSCVAQHRRGNRRGRKRTCHSERKQVGGPMCACLPTRACGGVGVCVRVCMCVFKQPLVDLRDCVWVFEERFSNSIINSSGFLDGSPPILRQCTRTLSQ